MSIVTMTNAAAARLSTMNQRSPNQFIRLSTKASGCSGYKYLLDLVDKVGAHDECVKHEDATIYVDPASLMHVLGTRIDWVDTGLERKFVFENPMAVSHCGCGESFSVG
jgi:iron-sulfur cluster assembly accessory protein